MRLRVSISTMFLALIIPLFSAFSVYIYKTNYEIYKNNAADLIIAHNSQAIDNFSALLDPISDSLLTLAKQVQDNPALFHNGNLHGTMQLHLDNNPHLVSVFTASDQGKFQQVQRMLPHMIIAGRATPEAGKYNTWVTERKDPDSDSSPIHSIFTIFDETGNLIDRFSVQNNYDPRLRPFYKALMDSYHGLAEAERHRYVLIDKPYISTSTKKPTINVSTPVVIDGQVRGMVGESFELETLRGFLKDTEISQGSMTYVLDQKGTILVATGPDTEIRVENSQIVSENLSESRVATVRLAAERHKNSGEMRFDVQAPETGEFYLAQFNSFPNSMRSDWKVLTIAPVNDFLAGLNAINKQLVLFGSVACTLLVGLSYLLSRTISRPIELLTEQIEDLMDFQDRPLVKSNIHEINILSDAVTRLRSTLYAFTSYVPRDLVSDLLKSGNAISLGGESRYLTIMFTDLQGFSTISEVKPSKLVLRSVSSYLELVTYAVKEEIGTVDKFIGDAVMAFWGAPLWNANHAYHACVAAIKSQRRMVRLNEQLQQDGMDPLVVRIGIHSDGVLVGNIGSLERMSYTVMGDGVNIAARLEGINKEFNTRICISHATYKETGELLWTRPIDEITVKGRKGELTIYELLGTRHGDPEIVATQNEQDLCEKTWQAYLLFQKHQYGEAAAQYAAIAEQYQDRVAAIMRDKCRTLAGCGEARTAVLPPPAEEA